LIIADGNTIPARRAGIRPGHDKAPMNKTVPHPRREELGFAEAVAGEFAFLEEKGFRRTRSSATLVRYESERVFVNVYHGRASYELNVEIGLRTASPDEPERPFSIAEIIELRRGQHEKGFTPPQSTMPEGMQEFVSQLASMVERDAEPSLTGDALFFEQLSRFRVEKSDAYLRELKLKNARRAANAAWHDKDYARVIELYEPLQAALTPAELKKLAYARKHLNPE
jgi:hypothetical protein